MLGRFLSRRKTWLDLCFRKFVMKAVVPQGLEGWRERLKDGQIRSPQVCVRVQKRKMDLL